MTTIFDGDRRHFLALAGATAAAGFIPTRFAIAGNTPVRIGILLPYSGTYAMLGDSITNAFKMRIDEAGGKVGGRPVEYVAIDSEMSVPKAGQNVNKLISKQKADFIIGPVHSGIAAVMAKIIGKKGSPIMIDPNAGSNAVTGALCAPNIFRTSFSNWQTAVMAGPAMYDAGHRTIITISWKYGAGIQMMQAGRASFEKVGGKSVKDILNPFPSVEFQAHLSTIADMKPDAVFAFFSGGGAIKFLKDYEAAGLKAKIPLYGTGFLTEGVEKPAGSAAEGIQTTLHYARDLPNETNQRFIANYEKKFGSGKSNVFAVQGYDSASLLLQGMAAVDGDVSAQSKIIGAMESTVIDSPRGKFSFSKSHNPVQNIYLREVRDGKQVTLKTLAKGLEDPAVGCKA